MLPGKIRYGNEASSGMMNAVSLLSPIGGSFPFRQIWTLKQVRNSSIRKSPICRQLFWGFACCSMEVKFFLFVGRLIGHAMLPGNMEIKHPPEWRRAVSLVSPIGGSFPFGQIRTLKHVWWFKPSQDVLHKEVSHLQTAVLGVLPLVSAAQGFGWLGESFLT